MVRDITCLLTLPSLTRRLIASSCRLSRSDEELEEIRRLSEMARKRAEDAARARFVLEHTLDLNSSLLSPDEYSSLPLDDDPYDGHQLKYGSFTTNDMLWTFPPIDPFTLRDRHASQCRLFEQQEHSCSARPGPEIIRAALSDLPVDETSSSYGSVAGDQIVSAGGAHQELPQSSTPATIGYTRHSREARQSEVVRARGERSCTRGQNWCDET